MTMNMTIYIISYHLSVVSMYVCMTQDGLGSCIGEIAQEFSYKGEGIISIVGIEILALVCSRSQRSCSNNDSKLFNFS